MIITIPYFPGYTNYEYLAKAINKQGRQDGHCVLIMSRRADEAAAMAFENSVKNSFSHHVHRVIDPPRVSGKYAVSNEMLRQTLWYMDKHEPGKGEAPGMPLLYLEAAVRPAKPGWANAIQSEYFALGAPKVLASFKEHGGRPIPFGSILFSLGYGKASALLPSLPPQKHWREYLMHEIGRLAEVSTTLVPGSKGVFVIPRPRKPAEA